MLSSGALLRGLLKIFKSVLLQLLVPNIHLKKKKGIAIEPNYATKATKNIFHQEHTYTPLVRNRTNNTHVQFCCVGGTQDNFRC
jgi:hypothetical protein